MSKRGYISRYLLIIKKLKAKPYSTYEELSEYIEKKIDRFQLQDDSLSVGFSKRTLQRDLKEIRNLFGVDIEFSKIKRGYFISDSEGENMNFQRMIEAFDMFHSLNFAQGFEEYVHLEKHRPQGTENLHGVIHAIKNQLQISFSYQKFWEDDITHRLFQPYVVKEFKNRWYILGREQNNDIIKTFALDRLTELEITNQKFKFPKDFNPEEFFKNCFGIITPNGEKPVEIILSFNPVQGKYAKTLPLHETQTVIKDDKDELQVKLELCVTHDLVMELLTYGDNMKVIKPKSLANEIKLAHKKAYERYQ